MNTRKERLAQWARDLLSREFVIFDVETTGLDYDWDRIVQIGVIDHTGKVLLDTLIKPCVHIPPEATQIHGITNEMVKDAPTFGEIHPSLFEALNYRVWVCYNLDFDRGFLVEECARHNLRPPLPSLWADTDPAQRREMYCAMSAYAAFWGEQRWSGGYKWQRLTDACAQQGIEVNGAHSAVGDCLMTLALLNKMAGVE